MPDRERMPLAGFVDFFHNELEPGLLDFDDSGAAVPENEDAFAQMAAALLATMGKSGTPFSATGIATYALKIGMDIGAQYALAQRRKQEGVQS